MLNNKIPILPKNNINLTSCCYWEEFLTEEDIDKINSLPQWSNLRKGKIGGASGLDTVGNINNSIRETEISFMYFSEELKEIWFKISNTISEINSRFFNFDLTGCYEGAQLSLYTEENKSHYNWHIDGTVTDRNVPRKLSMVLSLSDPNEFEGGLLQIKYASDSPITLEIKKGRAWFFPSYLLHRVTPVTKGIRKSLVIWIGGPSFK